MLYYTQLIFLKAGKEESFHTFEDRVLPMLERHNGVLLYRVRPSSTDVLATNVGYPYEIHFISFSTRADFDAYVSDPERLQHLPLKEESIVKALLIEGKLL